MACNHSWSECNDGENIWMECDICGEQYWKEEWLNNSR